MTGATPRILGTGHSVPGTIRLNDDPIFDWLKENEPDGHKLFAGYDKRHILADGESMIDIMVPAAQLAMQDAGVEPGQIDMLLGDASISEYLTPNGISAVHHKLGLPARAWPIPVQNNFSQFNAMLMMADAFIRAGRATYVLIVLGDNWTRYVNYHTPQAISAADGAAACVVGPSDNAAHWSFVDQVTIADTSYYGSMFMDADEVVLTAEPASDGLPPQLYTHPYFHILDKGIEGFKEFGVKKAPEAVQELLGRHGIASQDICLITHQASTTLMDHWKQVINPGAYVQTIAQYANLVQCSVLFNLSWGMQNAPEFTQSWAVVLCLGPDMHANAILMRRNG